MEEMKGLLKGTLLEQKIFLRARSYSNFDELENLEKKVFRVNSE